MFACISAGCAPARAVAAGLLAAPLPDDGQTPQERGVVRLHIQPPGFDLRGATTCPSPCGRLVDGRGAARFFFAGPGTKAPESSHFRLNDATGDVTALVRPGDSFERSSGYVLVGISGYLLISAAQSMLVGVIVNEVTHDRAYVDPWYMSAGLNLTVAVGLVGAGLTFIDHGSTTFQLRPGKPSYR